MTKKQAIRIGSETKKRLKKELKKYQGTLVLDTFEIKRLIGLDEDKMDYYYIYQPLRGKREYVSCVCSFVPLKSRLKKDEYKRLEVLFEMNCIKEDDIPVTIFD